MSFVLNQVPGIRITEETRRRVLAAARELNYQPDASARRLVTGRTRILAYVERQAAEKAFADAFLPQVLRGVHDAAHAAGYEVLFAPIPVDEGQARCLGLLRGRHVDGMILSGPRSDDEELGELVAQRAPVVLQGEWPDMEVASVDVDNVAAARTATEHLLRQGHRRVGAILHGPLVYTAAAARQRGYEQALEAHGLTMDPEIVRTADFTPSSGEAAMEDLLASSEPPSAVFVGSDTVAIGALQAARRRGLRVPGDLALAGFDDIPLAVYVDPPLTTIRLPAYGIGWAAANLLIRTIAGEKVRVNRVILDTELVVRRSSGANRSANTRDL